MLFANNSNIQVIYNTTFHGLRRLTNLHLENNRILRFVGNEFEALDSLRELYLQNNRISYIDNRTFVELRKLEVLRLDNNKLMHFEIWQLAVNPYLVEIGLADNMWSCECTYLARFRTYLQSNPSKIIDSNRIACVYNNLTSVLKEKNGAKCTLKDGVAGISTIVRAQDIENLLPLLLAATCAFVGFFGLILGIFCYRRELKLWAHTHCLAAMCYKSSNFIDEFDKDRLYDAYITYSLQDEHFVNQILANTLENDVGYRLCLHYRDFNVNTYVADTIIEAVESSKRAVLVLSRNFLYNEWSRFEFKSAVHEVLKRRRKLIFILYGDLPQRDIDADMRLYLRTNTCIEWTDKKFWQKLRIALPHMRRNHCIAKRSAVNIYATQQQYSTATRRADDFSRRLDCGGGGGVGGGGGNNYATINDFSGRNNCDKYDSVSCKFSTATGDRRHGGGPTTNEMVQRLQTLDGRQHDYAVPAVCLKGSFHNLHNNSCDRGAVGDAGIENFECLTSNKYSLSLGSSSDCGGGSGGIVAGRLCSPNSEHNLENGCSGSDCNIVSSSSGAGSSSSGSGGGRTLPVTNLCNFNSKSLTHSISNGKCADDQCTNKCQLNCMENRRLPLPPQPMWA